MSNNLFKKRSSLTINDNNTIAQKLVNRFFRHGVAYPPTMELNF